MIAHLLTLSTAHISEETAKLWETRGNKNSDIVAKTECGYFMYAYDDLNDTIGLPKEVVKVCDYAVKEGATYILFDRDGDLVEGLEKFDW